LAPFLAIFLAEERPVFLDFSAFPSLPAFFDGGRGVKKTKYPKTQIPKKNPNAELNWVQAPPAILDF